MRSRIREALVVRLSAMVRSTAPIHRSDSTVPCSHEALPSDVDLHPGAPVPESWYAHQDSLVHGLPLSLHRFQPRFQLLLELGHSQRLLYREIILLVWIVREIEEHRHRRRREHAGRWRRPPNIAESARFVLQASVHCRVLGIPRMTSWITGRTSFPSPPRTAALNVSTRVYTDSTARNALGSSQALPRGAPQKPTDHPKGYPDPSAVQLRPTRLAASRQSEGTCVTASRNAAIRRASAGSLVQG